jgi:hypothetical protein
MGQKKRHPKVGEQVEVISPTRVIRNSHSSCLGWADYVPREHKKYGQTAKYVDRDAPSFQLAFAVPSHHFNLAPLVSHQRVEGGSRFTQTPDGLFDSNR